MTIYDLLMDFAFASVLILISQYLRAKVKLFQFLFMPASMIAGFIGLFLGKQFLNVIPFTKFIGSYAGALMILIFTIIGVNGFKSSNNASDSILKRSTSYMLYRFFLFFVQIAVPIVLTLGVLVKYYPQLNPGIALLLPGGFYGGHGTSAALGSTFKALGWADANDLGMTFSTIGILIGIIGGLMFIKWGTRNGHTQYIKDFSALDNSLRTGLIPPAEQHELARETISSVSLDPLAFHMAIAFATGGLGYALNRKILAPYVLKGIPDMTVAFLIGLLFFFAFRKTRVYDYVDTRLTNRISGTATDYLVFFGIASINTTIIINNIVPLLALVGVGILCTFIVMIPFGYKMNKDSWFERSIFVFGQFTGVFAIGFILLRIVDPENKSCAVEDTAMTPYMYFVEAIIWSIVPAMLMNGQGWYVAAVTGALAVACIILAVVGKMWYTAPLSQRGKVPHD